MNQQISSLKNELRRVEESLIASEEIKKKIEEDLNNVSLSLFVVLFLLIHFISISFSLCLSDEINQLSTSTNHHPNRTTTEQPQRNGIERRVE